MPAMHGCFQMWFQPQQRAIVCKSLAKATKQTIETHCICVIPICHARCISWHLFLSDILPLHCLLQFSVSRRFNFQTSFDYQVMHESSLSFSCLVRHSSILPHSLQKKCGTSPSLFYELCNDPFVDRCLKSVEEPGHVAVDRWPFGCPKVSVLVAWLRPSPRSGANPIGKLLESRKDDKEMR